MYQGIYLCSNLNDSLLTKVVPAFESLIPSVTFAKHSFSEMKEYLNLNPFICHLAVAELPEPDTDHLWFVVVRELLIQVPHCKIIFILEGSLSSYTYQLNQIPYTYLLPLNQAKHLLKTGLDKAVSELELSRFHPGSANSSNLPFYPGAVFFSTDGILHRGKRGCTVHYSDGKTEYLRASLKTIQNDLPDNYIQIHKSYVANMNCCETIITHPRASGNINDPYLLLSTQYHADMGELPIGPKYESKIREYLMNKFAYPYLGKQKEGKEC